MTRALHAAPRWVRWPYALLPALLFVMVACGDDDTSRSNEIVAPAIDACSRVGNSGDMAPCDDSVRFARERCATLSAPSATTCAAEANELTIAAREAYHLHHGECDAMTTDAARSACALTASLQADPTATPAAIAAAASTSPPSSSDDRDDAEEEPTMQAGEALAGALWACSIVEIRGDDDACEQALEDAKELCDRLDVRAARNDCERALGQLDLDGQQPEGSSSRGNGRGYGNGNANGND